MNDRYRVDHISGGAVAFGPGASAQFFGGGEPPVFAAVRAELDLLAAGLAQNAHGGAARFEVVTLRQTLTEPKPDPEQVRGLWLRVRQALVAVGVTGAVAFGADFTQLSQGVADILKYLTGGG